MKHSLPTACLAAVLAAGAAPAFAAGTTAPRTNFDLTISVAVTGYATGAAKPLTVTSRDLIQALNGTTNSAGAVNQFSTSARLVFRQVLSGTNVTATGQFVLDGSGANATATDVTSLFSRTIADEVKYTNGTRVITWSFDIFQNTAGTPAILLEGVTRTDTTRLSSGAVLPGSFHTPVSGTAVTGSGPGRVTNVMTGTISAGGGQLD